MNLVDASNIERNLYLTTQLLEMGIPVVIALNMMDIVKKRGDVIDVKKLSQELGVPVVEKMCIRDRSRPCRLTKPGLCAIILSTNGGLLVTGGRSP